MALLTAEDVLNKAFSKTRYREGFDQDEVDDFLDEIAHTISSLTTEREELERALNDAKSAPAPAAQAATVAPAPQAAPEPEPAPVGADPAAVLSGAMDASAPGAAGMFALASKLHDEFVRAGEEEKDQIIADAKRERDEILAAARETATKDIAGRKDDLAKLESKIDDLRAFESDYRARLRQHLEGLVGELDASIEEPKPAATRHASGVSHVADLSDDVPSDDPYTPRWGGPGNN